MNLFYLSSIAFAVSFGLAHQMTAGVDADELALGVPGRQFSVIDGSAAMCRTRPARGAEDDSSTAAPAVWNAGPNGLMLAGHDPVAYREQGTARQGTPMNAARRGSEIYWFVSVESRTAFLMAPERYVPAYGGFSAAGIRDGVWRDPDPRIFLVVGGRLLLFNNQDQVRDWTEDADQSMRIADTVWVRLAAIAARRERLAGSGRYLSAARQQVIASEPVGTSRNDERAK